MVEGEKLVESIISKTVNSETAAKRQPKTMEECFYEIKRLQKKSNLLIDYLGAAKQQIGKLKNENSNLKRRLGVNTTINQRDTDVIMFQITGEVMKRLRKELENPDKQIPFKNNTDLAKEYIRVRKNDIESVIREVVAEEREEQVIDFLIDLGIFRKGSRAKALFSVKDEEIGKFVSVYFVRKTAVGITGNEGE